jgi:molybdopterin-guanine dinucleotide biosynthesis protein A
VVLAGGSGRRLGGADKAFVDLGGTPLVRHVVRRLRPQVDVLAINANGDPARFAGLGLPVIADSLDDAGPLAGILAGMRFARQQQPAAAWLASVAVDTPFFPVDLVVRLEAARKKNGAVMARACSDGRRHPVFGLWPVALAEILEEALLRKSMRRILNWTELFACAEAEFSAEPHDPFFNINRHGDLDTAIQIWRSTHENNS